MSSSSSSSNGRKRPRGAATPPRTARVNPIANVADDHILNGVDQTQGFTVTVQQSSRVHRRALAGDSITLLITPAQPYSSYESFTRAAFPVVYQQIGTNLISEFGRFVYTLQYQLTLKKLEGGEERE